MCENLLTKQEICLPRSPGQLSNWLKDKIDQIKSIDGGKHALRFPRGLCKTLMEEVRPLSMLASHLFDCDDNIILQPLIGEKSYDALLIDKRICPPAVRYLQITQAHEGENEYLRKEALYRDGYLISSAKVYKTGTKKQRGGRSIEVDNPTYLRRDDALLADELEKTVKLVVDRLRAKSAKTYECRTDLLIMFDDAFLVVADDGNHRNKIVNFMSKRLDVEIGKIRCPFCCVHVLGWYNRTLLSFEDRRVSCVAR